MKNKTLATVSAIALISTAPVLTQAVRAQTENKTETSTSGSITEDAKEAWENIKSDTSDAYEEVKATLIGDEKSDNNMSVTIQSRKTANGIIGNPVYNEKQERVAKVTDIILDENGKAMMVVVADGSFIGMGKKAAFDYSAITRVEKDGDVIMPLSETIIDNATTFSYDKKDRSDDVRIIPDNGYSVAKLLDGKLVNQKQETVADIENISFKNGSANQLIVGFNKVLGMGGESVALSYSDAEIIRDGENLNFQLSAKKSAQLEAYKKTATN